jgi:hypothetical protein
LILAAAASLSLAAAPATKVINAGDIAISLNWQDGWQVIPAPGNQPNSVAFSALDQHDLLVQITADSPPAGVDVDAHMRSAVDESARQFLTQSVEKDLPVQAFKNGGTKGYQVCATDKAPKPDEYKYICQGAAYSGDKLVVFTVLYNDGGKKQADKAVTALQSLQVTKGT